MQINKIFIIKDSREKLGFSFEEDEWCAGTKIQKLSEGDYTLENFNIIFIDRKKSVSEIAKNFTEKRFFNLLERTKDYKYKYIICEFSLSDVMKYPIDSEIPPKMWKKIRIRPKFLQEYICKISTIYNINFIFADNTKYAEKICYSLLKQIYKVETTSVQKN